MERFKFRIMLFFFLIIVLTGLFKVNVEYNSRRQIRPDEAVYNNNQKTGGTIPKIDLYTEIPFSKNPDRVLKIYYTGKPFDLRFNMGNRVMYINRQAYDNIVEEKNKIIKKIKDIINNGINNISTVSKNGVNAIKVKVKGRED